MIPGKKNYGILSIEMKPKKSDDKTTKDTRKYKKKDSEIFVDKFGKYLNELTDEEILEFWEDIQ